MNKADRLHRVWRFGGIIGLTLSLLTVGAVVAAAPASAATPSVTFISPANGPQAPP
jgi:hypothetical protein